MDRFSKEDRSKNMKAIKSKGSRIETLLMKGLWHRGYRYRKNDKRVFGKPDITFYKYKVAIFCDSEFWHGKDWETKKHEIKSNKKFWFNKIENNINRDKKVNEYLKNEGWVILRFWGKDIIERTDNCINEIIKVINERKEVKI